MWLSRYMGSKVLHRDFNVNGKIKKILDDDASNYLLLNNDVTEWSHNCNYDLPLSTNTKR